MADVTSRLRIVVGSTGLDKSGRKLRALREEAKTADERAKSLRLAFAGITSVIGAEFSIQQLKKVSEKYAGIHERLRLVTGKDKRLSPP